MRFVPLLFKPHMYHAEMKCVVMSVYQRFRIQTLTSLSQARHRRERHTVVPEIGEVIRERLKTRLVEETE